MIHWYSFKFDTKLLPPLSQTSELHPMVDTFLGCSPSGEAEIRNKQIEANRELRLFEIKSNELGAQWRADQRSLYKVIKELKKSWAVVDNKPHVNTFADMHDIGDQLLQSGFQSPVMEMETLTLTYTTASLNWKQSY
jgi:hypothetical protein